MSGFVILLLLLLIYGLINALLCNLHYKALSPVLVHGINRLLYSTPLIHWNTWKQTRSRIPKKKREKSGVESLRFGGLARAQWTFFVLLTDGSDVFNSQLDHLTTSFCLETDTELLTQTGRNHGATANHITLSLILILIFQSSSHSCFTALVTLLHVSFIVSPWWVSK